MDMTRRTRSYCGAKACQTSEDEDNCRERRTIATFRYDLLLNFARFAPIHLAQSRAFSVSGNDIRQAQSAARILLICPDCGLETAEFAYALRGMSAFYCTGNECDYIFDLAGPRSDLGKGIAQAWRKFCAAFYAMRRYAPRAGVR